MRQQLRWWYSRRVTASDADVDACRGSLDHLCPVLNRPWQQLLKEHNLHKAAPSSSDASSFLLFPVPVVQIRQSRMRVAASRFGVTDIEVTFLTVVCIKSRNLWSLVQESVAFRSVDTIWPQSDPGVNFPTTCWEAPSLGAWSVSGTRLNPSEGGVCVEFLLFLKAFF